MSNVLVNKDKLDVLANAIANKSGESLTLTLDEMVSAVDGIDTSGGTPTLETVTKTYTPTTSQQTDTITPSSGYDGIEEVDVTVSAIPIPNAVDDGASISYSTVSNQRRATIKPWVDYDDNGYVAVTQGLNYATGVVLNAIASGTSVTPTESSQTIGGSNYMMEGAVTVNAIPSNYVGSGITQRDSTDLSANGATVTAPSGYYASSASKSVASGTEGTPTATKGTVSNHAVTVTPSVTNSAGYISGGTHNGTAVTVSASELVSGSQTVTENDTYDVTNLATLVVNVSGGGGTSKNTQVVQGTTRTTSSSMTAIGAEMTVSKTGTYDVYWSAFRSNTSSSYTYATQLYIGGSAYGSENTTWSNHVQNVHLSNVSLTANQKIRVYGRESRNQSYYIYAPTLVIVEA